MNSYALYMEFSLGKSISSGTMLPSFLSREALDHAYEVLEATDGSGVNFVDFLLFMEEFKPQICKFNYFESVLFYEASNHRSSDLVN